MLYEGTVQYGAWCQIFEVKSADVTFSPKKGISVSWCLLRRLSNHVHCECFRHSMPIWGGQRRYNKLHKPHFIRAPVNTSITRSQHRLRRLNSPWMHFSLFLFPWLTLISVNRYTGVRSHLWFQEWRNGERHASTNESVKHNIKTKEALKYST